MRLNLARHHCVAFRINSEFRVAADRDENVQALMDRTTTRVHVHVGDDEESKNALFGSRYKSEEVTYQSLGLLSRIMSDGVGHYTLSITYNLASNELPRPPRRVRPVFLLLADAGHLFGELEVNCAARFEYDQTQGFRSKITFPVPLVLPEPSAGVTHIEGAEFSRRDDDGVQYRIQVGDLEDVDLVVHSVVFESTLELNPSSVRGLLEKARSISSRLLVREGDN